MISHKVAASFRADRDTCLPLEEEVGTFENSAFSMANEGDLALVFHVGNGVLDPPRFPTRIARLNLYLRTKEDEDEDEQPRFLILHTLSADSAVTVFPSKLWL